MPLTRYPNEALKVLWDPSIFTGSTNQIFPNWRLEQRTHPGRTDGEAEWNKYAGKGSPLRTYVEYGLHTFLKSLKGETRTLLVVHQSYGGDEISVIVERTSIFWAPSDGFPRFDLKNQSGRIWGPFVLCVAPLAESAPPTEAEEHESDIYAPKFMEIVRLYGIPKPA